MEQFIQQVAADSDNEISQQVAAKMFTVLWGRWLMYDGRWKKEEGRRMMEEGRGRMEDVRSKKEEG